MEIAGLTLFFRSVYHLTLDTAHCDEHRKLSPRRMGTTVSTPWAAVMDAPLRQGSTEQEDLE